MSGNEVMAMVTTIKVIVVTKEYFSDSQSYLTLNEDLSLNLLQA